MRVIEKAEITPLEPLLCSIKQGTELIARSERFIIDALAKGKIKGVKSDRRTLLIVQSLRDYVKDLQENHPAKGTINPPPRRRTA
jgi:hypothetical protein